MRNIRLLLIVALLQASGCGTLRPLKTLKQDEIKASQLKEGMHLRLVLEQDSELPFQKRSITCKVDHAEIIRLWDAIKTNFTEEQQAHIKQVLATPDGFRRAEDILSAVLLGLTQSVPSTPNNHDTEK